MRKLLLAALALLLVLGAVNAVAPRMVSELTYVNVTAPQLSQSFYGELNGAPEAYTIASDVKFNLNVTLMIPQGIKDSTKDYSLKIESNGAVVASIDGAKIQWKDYFDPYTGTYFWQGPQFAKDVAAGTYIITVSSPDNRGKYVLVVGTTDSFNPTDTLNAMLAAPALNTYLEQPPWGVFGGQIGILFLLLIFFVIGFAAIVVGVVYFTRREG